jgi:acyl carrier protein
LKGEELREQIEAWLRQWFASRGKIAKHTDRSLSNIDYFAAGWLSSLEVVEFVTEIEDRFRMQFSEADLEDERFVTISGLVELILESSTQPTQSR